VGSVHFVQRCYLSGHEQSEQENNHQDEEGDGGPVREQPGPQTGNTGGQNLPQSGSYVSFIIKISGTCHHQGQMLELYYEGLQHPPPSGSDVRLYHLNFQHHQQSGSDV
jgi:hypothetical protein